MYNQDHIALEITLPSEVYHILKTQVVNSRMSQDDILNMAIVTYLMSRVDSGSLDYGELARVYLEALMKNSMR